MARLPHPFSGADRAAGQRYDISILQAEYSLTPMLDKPVSGRIFFEQVIRDDLDIGRPDQIGLGGDRTIRRKAPALPPGPTPRAGSAPGASPTVTPSLPVDYKNSKIKQYHKLGRALRIETTINDTRDVGIGNRLTQPTGLPADRLLRQPASPGRPTTQPRPRPGAPTPSPLRLRCPVTRKSARRHSMRPVPWPCHCGWPKILIVELGPVGGGCRCRSLKVRISGLCWRPREPLLTAS
jgi:hypothetical protein